MAQETKDDVKKALVSSIPLLHITLSVLAKKSHKGQNTKTFVTINTGHP
jgi:hypothetical protein